MGLEAFYFAVGRGGRKRSRSLRARATSWQKRPGTHTRQVRLQSRTRDAATRWDADRAVEMLAPWVVQGGSKVASGPLVGGESHKNVVDVDCGWGPSWTRIIMDYVGVRRVEGKQRSRKSTGPWMAVQSIYRRRDGFVASGRGVMRCEVRWKR